MKFFNHRPTLCVWEKEDKRRCKRPMGEHKKEIVREVLGKLERLVFEHDLTQSSQLIREFAKLAVCGVTHRTGAQEKIRMNLQDSKAPGYGKLTIEKLSRQSASAESVTIKTTDIVHVSTRALDESPPDKTKDDTQAGTVPVYLQIERRRRIWIRACSPQGSIFSEYQAKEYIGILAHEYAAQVARRPLPGHRNSGDLKGHVYVFWDPRYEGMAKIGCEKECSEAEIGVKAWASCGYISESDRCTEVISYYCSEMIPHYDRVEKIVHAQLEDHQKRFQCPRPKCRKTRHKEFFDNPVNIIIRTVDEWCQFMLQSPYEKEQDPKSPNYTWYLKKDFQGDVSKRAEFIANVMLGSDEKADADGKEIAVRGKWHEYTPRTTIKNAKQNVRQRR